MTGDGWKWINMAEIGWNWMQIAGNGWNRWQWLTMA